MGSEGRTYTQTQTHNSNCNLNSNVLTRSRSRNRENIEYACIEACVRFVGQATRLRRFKMEGGHSWGCPAWLPAKEAGAVIARHLTRECYYHGFRVLELLPATAVPVLLLDVRRSGPGAAGPRVFPPRPSPSFQLNSMRLHPRAMRRWRRNAVRPRCLYFWMAEDDPCLGPGLNWYRPHHLLVLFCVSHIVHLVGTAS